MVLFLIFLLQLFQVLVGVNLGDQGHSRLDKIFAFVGRRITHFLSPLVFARSNRQCPQVAPSQFLPLLGIL